jgi:fructose 1,6-bisphosphate aldolase/phosphatase
MRGSHIGSLMPVKMNSSVAYFDGPPVVCALGFCVHHGKLTEPADAFLTIPTGIGFGRKAAEIRQQGCSGAAMLPYSELEYGGITEKMRKLDARFKVRK